MTCNFRNAAGTDLDDVFYVINSNAGALGFKCSNGQDLGNRYPAGSLGTNVGYKSSAGTDIGYLRTRIVAPSCAIGIRQTNRWKGYSREDGPGTDYPDYKIEEEKRAIRAEVTVSNGMPISGVDWYLEYRSDLSSAHWRVKANTANMNDLPSNFDLEISSTGLNFVRSSKLHSSSILYCDFTFYGKSRSMYTQHCYVWAKAVAYVYNAAGGVWVTSEQMQVLNYDA